MIDEIKITIFHSASEIGGNTILLQSGKDSILLDCGSPLTDVSGKKTIDYGILSKANALILSHPHLDHTGEVSKLADLPIYLGHDTAIAVNVQTTHTKKGIYLKKRNIQYFEPYKKFVIGSFTILPIPVNHSAYGSYSFIIEANQKRIFYSGDL